MSMKATTADAYRLVHEGVLALNKAERQGIRIDIDYCEKKTEQLTKRIERHERKFSETEIYKNWHGKYGRKTNIYSGHQLGDILYNVMKIKTVKTTKSGKGATDEEALELLIPNYPELRMVLLIRKLAKVRDTYLRGFMREATDGYIHPNFNLHTTKTYRSSSNNPNFQNIPKRDKQAMETCRQALFPRPGHQLMEADFASLEVHVSALYHKDPQMITYLQDPNADMHSDVARDIFIMKDFDRKLPEHNVLRNAAKNGFVFPQFYGDYYANNAVVLTEWTKLPHTRWKEGQGIEMPEGTHISDHMIDVGIKSYDEFVSHLQKMEDNFWNVRFQKYGEWRRKVVSQYRKRGYLDMYTGFRCSGIMRNNEIINYPVQGTAFHCLLATFIEMDKRMREENWNTKLIGQIHDSIVIDVYPEELEHVQETVQDIVKVHLPEKWDWITIPFEIDMDLYDVDSCWIMK